MTKHMNSIFSLTSTTIQGSPSQRRQRSSSDQFHQTEHQHPSIPHRVPRQQYNNNQDIKTLNENYCSLFK